MITVAGLTRTIEQELDSSDNRRIVSNVHDTITFSFVRVGSDVALNDKSCAVLVHPAFEFGISTSDAAVHEESLTYQELDR